MHVPRHIMHVSVRWTTHWCGGVMFGESWVSHMRIWTYHVSHDCMYQITYQLTYQTYQIMYQIHISLCTEELWGVCITPYHVSLGGDVSNSYRTFPACDIYRTPYRVRIRCVIHGVRIWHSIDTYRVRLEGVTHIVHISYVSERIRYAVSCVIVLRDISWYAYDIKTRYEPKKPLSSFCEI